MKRKALTITICFLALVSIVSIGFASWIITKPIQEQSAAGSITAEAVKVEGYTLAVKWLDLESPATEPTIHFGKPETPAAATPGVTPWLSADSESKVESLTCKLHITVSNTGNISNGLTLTLNTIIGGVAKELDDVETAFGFAIDQGYIAMPTVKVASKQAVAYDPDDKVSIAQGDFTADSEGSASGYCDVIITFAWGSKFGGENPVNPLDYYNQHNYDDEEAAKAQTALEAIKAIQTAGTSYKVTVNATPAA